jgi:aromatic ring-opening dioxygenase catalytic subunit (LigB family)
MSKAKMPVVYLPHGGGPWPFMDRSAFGPQSMYDQMQAYLEGLSIVPPQKPRALLVVSAHWEEAEPTLMTSAMPPMFYDYSGFPPETYALKWPAPGAPDVAHEVIEQLATAGVNAGVAAERGFDHGTFVPLMIAWPKAEVPTLQISLKKGLDPVEHLAIGRALAPLREQGVFIIGSGMSYHNMRGFFGRVPTVAEDSKAFDDWLAETVAADPSTRDQRLAEWERAPRARAAHPREEHLLPLMVCAGAAGEDAGTTPYRDVIMNAHVSAAHFG